MANAIPFASKTEFGPGPNVTTFVRCGERFPSYTSVPPVHEIVGGSPGLREAAIPGG
jgi:hypothetical protein